MKRSALLLTAASSLLAACASVPDQRQAVAECALHHEWAEINGWVDHPDQLCPPREYDHEPTRLWSLDVVRADDPRLRACRNQNGYTRRGEIVACTTPSIALIHFSEAFATPYIWQIAADHSQASRFDTVVKSARPVPASAAPLDLPELAMPAAWNYEKTCAAFFEQTVAPGVCGSKNEAGCVVWYDPARFPFGINDPHEYCAVLPYRSSKP